MRLSTSKYIDAIVFTLFSVVNLFFVSVMTDLKPAMGNWADKAREIMMLQVPTDNFYGPGGAISLIPFLWNGPTYVIANFFYCALGSFFFFLITKKIENTKIRYLSLSVLIFNPYIYWLFYSSQDTAVEFALLSLSIYALIRNRIWIYIFSTFILVVNIGYFFWLFLVFKFTISEKNCD
jgi:hypothetical protein